MGVSENSGPPKSSILVGVFHYKPSILGVFPIFGNSHIRIALEMVLSLFFPFQFSNLFRVGGFLPTPTRKNMRKSNWESFPSIGMNI